MESGLHSSLHPNCHHQITYAKFNLKIYYPSPHEREIWHYGKANVDHIRKAINEFPWGRSFENHSVNEKVNIDDDSPQERTKFLQCQHKISADACFVLIFPNLLWFFRPLIVLCLSCWFVQV